MLSLLKTYEPEIVRADVYDNAYTYYQQHGNEMSFLPGVDSQGEIYYATQAKKDEHTGIKYTTLGWKIRVFDSGGTLVETLYYKLGGTNMVSVDVRTVNGYEYCLYRVTLTNMKQRMSKAGLKALEHPNCSIVFDACTTTKINGVVQGGMSDAGPEWGKVFTSYNGIVNAQNWSSATKQTLKSYYNKTVEGLFYNVKLQGDAGIKGVYGEGRYCFGTMVTVTADVKDGYHFYEWDGNHGSIWESFSFEIYGTDVVLTARTKENTYFVQYEGGNFDLSIPTKTVLYSQNIVLPQGSISQDGAKLSGWMLSDMNGEQYFAVGENISIKELVHARNLQRRNGATLTFHAVWDQGPQITTEHIYVSKKDALAGLVTEEWLAKKAQAIDPEEGIIPYGKRDGASFFLEKYEATRYTKCEGEGVVKECFFASDSVGNEVRKEVSVHIVDASMYPADKVTGRVRFISKKYFKNEDGNFIEAKMGGLDDDSIWRWNRDYLELLEDLFS